MLNARRACLPLTAFVLLAVSSTWATAASAAVAWHPDLATACRASAASHRPVLAIFTASWSSSTAALDRTTLASDEAVALITACFEPVCVDVDALPEATRRLGITRVPTACILSADERLLSRFELPETPAGFVAAAARAAQEAANGSARGMPAPGAAAASTAAAGVVGLVKEADAATNTATNGSVAVPVVNIDSSLLQNGIPGEVRGTVPAGGGAISAVTAKVRTLSDFASNDTPGDANGDATIATSFHERERAAATTTPAYAPLAAPTFSSDMAPMPNTTGGVPATASSNFQTLPPAGPTTAAFTPSPAAAVTAGQLGGQTTQTPLSIEPAPAAAPGRSAGWLATPEQTVPVAAPQPAAVSYAAAPAAAPYAALPAAPWTAPGTSPAAPTTVPPAASAAATVPQPQGQPGAAAAAVTDPQPAATPEKSVAQPKPSLLATLQKPFAMFSKSTAAKPAAGTAGDDRAKVADTNAASPNTPDAYGSMPVGLEGYCPVTLAERGVWVEGRAQWGARHRGRTYLFAGAEQQRTFLADPDRYAPALSGDDPVLAFDAGKSTPGQRRYGVTYQSRTYLFSTAETRDAFAANPQRYTSGTTVAENRVPAGAPVTR